DGTSLPRAIHALEDYSQVIAVGINCVKLELVEPALKNMKEITDKHLIVYTNSSAVYDPKSKTWSQPKTSATFEELIPNWYEAGARNIGGCCTTGAKEIKAVADFRKRNKQSYQGHLSGDTWLFCRVRMNCNRLIKIVNHSYQEP